jgi:hypothetical protein
MCQKKECCSIEIIEIHDKVKVVIHYDKNEKPILIQYWDDRKSPYTQILFDNPRND